VRRLILAILFFPIFLLVYEPLQGQINQETEDISETGDLSEDEMEIVRRVRFTGNRNVSNRALKTLVRTRSNREFLGIRRFTPWYYIWRVFGVGEAPRLLDREMIANDIERINVYYENFGFFEAEVDTSIIEFRENRFEVTFLIDEGPSSRINTVSYTGLPELESEDVKRNFFRNSGFSGSMVNDSTFSYDSAYRAQELREEQTRIIDFLKDHGYAAVQRDSVRALLKRGEDDPNELDVLFAIRPGDIYSFGNVYIDLLGPEGQNNYDESITLEGDPHTLPGFTINCENRTLHKPI
jgi:outer membrane protein insertion porin family